MEEGENAEVELNVVANISLWQSNVAAASYADTTAEV